MQILPVSYYVVNVLFFIFFCFFPLSVPITVAAIICNVTVKLENMRGHLLILYKVSGVKKMGEKLRECWDAKGV